jgi:hypothetical protein
MLKGRSVTVANCHSGWNVGWTYGVVGMSRGRFVGGRNVKVPLRYTHFVFLNNSDSRLTDHWFQGTIIQAEQYYLAAQLAVKQLTHPMKSEWQRGQSDILLMYIINVVTLQPVHMWTDGNHQKYPCDAYRKRFVHCCIWINNIMYIQYI